MHNSKNRIFNILIVVFLSVFLFINSKAITNQTRAKFLDFVSSPLKSLNAFAKDVRAILPFASLRDENKVLRERIALFERKFEEMKMLYDENERLKNLIDFKKTLSYATIPARVIGRDPSNWSNSLIIDKGATQGIRQNKAVVSAKGLVGRVIEIGGYSGKILLITDPNSKVGVVIQRNRQGGIIVGRPDGKCKMIYIALDSDVTAGDKVVTAGLGSVFPKDILVGEVISVGKEEGRLYKYALVKTAADLSKIEEVLCVK